MGQAVTLFTPAEWHLASLARCFERCEYHKPQTLNLVEDQLEVSSSDGGYVRIYEGPDKDPMSGFDYKVDFASNEYLDEQFRHDVAALQLFLVTFNDLELVRGLLRCVMQEIVNSGNTAWIDTDYGWVISAKDFLARTDQDPDWDWRAPLPEDQ